MVEHEGGAEPHSSPMADRKEKFGGYDTNFVEQVPSAFQTVCPICHLILRDPYQATCCGTNFCNSCCQQIDDSKPCPVCRDDNFKTSPNLNMKHALSQCQVLCTHSKDGCKWTGELGDLEHHLKNVVHPGESLLFKWADHYCSCWRGSHSSASYYSFLYFCL